MYIYTLRFRIICVGLYSWFSCVGEGEVAIAPNGSLIANYRGSHPYKRVLAYSNDRGETWGPGENTVVEGETKFLEPFFYPFFCRFRMGISS